MKRKVVFEKGGVDKKKKNRCKDVTNTDGLRMNSGHFYGNFRNYYAFHPTQPRMDVLAIPGGVLDYIAEHWNHRNSTNNDDTAVDHQTTPFTMCDVGCNEGDLTMGLATALGERIQTSIRAVGIDLDPLLIQRACDKYTTSLHIINNNNNSNNQNRVEIHFQVANVLQSLASLPESGVHLLSLMSTIMWIHIHAGDDGLLQLLDKLCDKTLHFLLIEPQPSKCYTAAAVRMKKLGLPKVDVSPQRLSMRPCLEETLDRVLAKNGFHRVGRFASCDTHTSSSWNRTLCLYERR